MARRKGPTTIEAEKLVIVDKEGRPRITIGMLGESSPSIQFNAEDGHLVASLREANRLPVLHFWDRDQNLRVSITIAPDGSSAFVAGDHKGNGNVLFGTMGEEPCMVLRDKDGNVKAISTRFSPRIRRPPKKK